MNYVLSSTVGKEYLNTFKKFWRWSKNWNRQVCSLKLHYFQAKKELAHIARQVFVATDEPGGFQLLILIITEHSDAFLTILVYLE